MASVRLLLLPALVLAAVGLVALRPPTVPAQAADDPLTLVDWNLHYGVSPLTAVDLEGIAQTIEEQDADVVTLQEVERGWIFGGGRRHGHVAVPPPRHDRASSHPPPTGSSATRCCRGRA